MYLHPEVILPVDDLMIMKELQPQDHTSSIETGEEERGI